MMSGRLLIPRTLGQLARTRMMSSASSKGEIAPIYFKVKETQKKYQVDNGLKIHERHGPAYRALYYFTLALLGYGLVDAGVFVYQSIYPPKK